MPTVPPSTGINTFKFGQDLVFDVYIQYKEYMCFVKCMEALRGMKLMHINVEGKAYTANIKVWPYRRTEGTVQSLLVIKHLFFKATCF